MSKPTNTNKLIKDNSPYKREEEYPLGDLTLWRVGSDIIEAVVNEGVDANGQHVQQMFACTEGMQPVPGGLVINRENDYSIDLSVLWQARKNNPFKFVAMVNNGRKHQYFPESIWPKFLKLGIFNERHNAIDWLNEKLKNT